MRTILGVILLAFLAAIGLFALQNMQTVSVRFANWTLTAPVAFLAVVVYLLGMVSGWTVLSFLRRSFNRVTAESRSRVE
jgi:putative membrane protein